METRSTELARPTAQWAVVSLPDGRRNWGRCEGCRVHPLIHIVLSGIQIHPGNFQGIAAETRSRCDGARDRTGLAVLQSQDPVGVPTAHDRVEHAAAAAQKMPAMPEWQFIYSAEVDHFVNVEIAT